MHKSSLIKGFESVVCV